MPTLNLKWKNLSIAIRIKLSADAVYLIAIFVAILYAVLSKWIKPMADNFLAGEGAIWAISATILAEKHGANKLDVEAAKANAGANLNAIKMAAAGIPAVETPGPPEEKKT
jgi:hypothetical protein